MRGTAYYCTVEELQKRGRAVPVEYASDLQFSGDTCI